jgi:serine/threonine-protein kinase
MPEPAPTPASADRNLLFGVLALQMDFITRDALVKAMNAWVLDKHKPLGQILIEQGALRGDTRAALEVVVGKHLELHGGDPQRSLAAVSSIRSVRQELGQVADPDLQASLAQVSVARQAEPDPDLTSDYSAGTPTSSGLRFRVLRPHARGGLGEVFVARDQELHREVALKEIQACHDDPRSRSRFLLEAEVTGGLEHPGVVPVYGLGVYPDGRPFYAMRLIKGDSLKDAIKRFHAADGPGRDPGERRLALRGLLGRFVAVCNAVAYAHSRGVLHRDLKPSNVMLGPYGETLVVDWGLAKVVGRPAGSNGASEGTLRPPSAEGSTPTQVGAAVGTPAYMSPEQAAGKVEELCPASDVYSLGATLYCLLTGRAPFEGKDTGEVLRQVQAGAFAPPRQVKRAVPAALEAVCLKGMALRPADRYGSARALADDIEHWLADEPVAAYREPWPARLARWGRRHRPLVAAGAALLVTAVVGLGLGLAAVEQERRHTANERDQKDEALRAETRARTLAMQALRQLTDDVVEQQLARRAQLTDEDRRFLRDIQRQYEEFAALPGEDAEQRAIRAEGHFRVGLVRARLGEGQEAEAAYREALGLYQYLAADFPGRPEFRQDLAKTHGNLGNLLQDTGRPKEAEAAYAAALAIQKQLAADFPSRPEFRWELAKTHHNLGNLLKDTGRLQEAEAAFRDALAIFKQLAADFPGRPEFRRELAGSHYSLGVLLKDTGRLKGAEAAYADSLAIQKRLAADFPGRPELRQRLANSLNSLGNLLKDTGRPKEAEAAYTDALALHKQLAADFPSRPEFRHDLAGSLDNLGNLLKDTGRLQEAEAAFRDALAIDKQLAADFPGRPEFRRELAGSHYSLGVLLMDTGRLQEAEAAYADALALQKQLAADFPSHPKFRQELARSHYSLGFRLKSTGRLQEAEAAYAVALAIRKQLAADFPSRPQFRHELARSHGSLGVLLMDTGRPKEAEAAYRDALAIQKQLAADFPSRPEFRQGLAGNHINLGNLLSDTGRPKEAEAAYADALAIQKQLAADFPSRPEFRWELATSQNNLGAVLHDTGRLKEAEASYADALAIRKQLAADFPTRPEFRQHLATSHKNLGNLLKDTGRLQEAGAAYAAALALQKQLAADFPSHPKFRQMLANSHNSLGNLLSDTGRPKEAEAAYADALALQKQLAADFPQVPDYRNALAGTLVNRAVLANRRRDFGASRRELAEALPHHQAALQASPRDPTNRQFYRNHLLALIVSCAGLQDRAAAVRAAETLRDLGWDPAGNAYDAACGLALCIPLVEKDPQADAGRRHQQAQFYGDQALAMLRTAVAKGYQDAAHMRKDKDLDPLRGRDDFQKLLAELEKGAPKEKPKGDRPQR